MPFQFDRAGPRWFVAQRHDDDGWAMSSKIPKKPDRGGGDACIRETRIPVWTVVNYRRLGASDARVLEAYPSLTPSDLEAAWEYAASQRG
jgi:uncharacterized protein (DUF433 family)